MTPIELSGASRFLEYLRSVVAGELTIEGPEVLGRNYDVDCAKRWIVRVNGEILGEYMTFGPKPAETEFGREYHGRIPGYVSEEQVSRNLHLAPGEEPTPTDLVQLVFANERCEYVDKNLLRYIKGKGELTAKVLERLEEEPHHFTGRTISVLVDTLWQRQDGHTTIPFP